MIIIYIYCMYIYILYVYIYIILYILYIIYIYTNIIKYHNPFITGYIASSIPGYKNHLGFRSLLICSRTFSLILHLMRLGSQLWNLHRHFHQRCRRCDDFFPEQGKKKRQYNYIKLHWRLPHSGKSEMHDLTRPSTHAQPTT